MYTASDSYVVQHNLDLSGGTSGSPIFDDSGQVVAINNAGIEADVADAQHRSEICPCTHLTRLPWGSAFAPTKFTNCSMRWA